MGFSRQEHWSGFPFPSPEDLLDPGIEPRFPALQADFLLTEPPGNHIYIWLYKRVEIYIYIHSFLDSISLLVITKYWTEFPVLCSKFLILYHFYAQICVFSLMTILDVSTLPLNDLSLKWIRLLLFALVEGSNWIPPDLFRVSLITWFGYYHFFYTHSHLCCKERSVS